MIRLYYKYLPVDSLPRDYELKYINSEEFVNELNRKVVDIDADNSIAWEENENIKTCDEYILDFWKHGGVKQELLSLEKQRANIIRLIKPLIELINLKKELRDVVSNVKSVDSLKHDVEQIKYKFDLLKSDFRASPVAAFDGIKKLFDLYIESPSNKILNDIFSTFDFIQEIIKNDNPKISRAYDSKIRIEEKIKKLDEHRLINTPLKDLYDVFGFSGDSDVNKLFRSNIRELFIRLVEEYLAYREGKGGAYDAPSKIYYINGYVFTLSPEDSHTKWSTESKGDVVLINYKLKRPVETDYGVTQSVGGERYGLQLSVIAPSTMTSGRVGKYTVPFGEPREENSPINLSFKNTSSIYAIEPQSTLGKLIQVYRQYQRYTGFKNEYIPDILDILRRLRNDQIKGDKTKTYMGPMGETYRVVLPTPGYKSRKTLRENFDMANENKQLQNNILNMVKCINENKMGSALSYLQNTIAIKLKDRIKKAIAETDK